MRRKKMIRQFREDACLCIFPFYFKKKNNNMEDILIDIFHI